MVTIGIGKLLGKRSDKGGKAPREHSVRTKYDLTRPETYLSTQVSSVACPALQLENGRIGRTMFLSIIFSYRLISVHVSEFTV